MNGEINTNINTAEGASALPPEAETGLQIWNPPSAVQVLTVPPHSYSLSQADGAEKSTHVLVPPGHAAKRPARSHSDPHRLGEEYLTLYRKDREGRLVLRSWKGEFWLWEGQAYRRLEDDDLEAELSLFIRYDFDRRGAVDNKGVPLRVTPYVVKSTMAALAALTHIAGHHEQPVGVGTLKGRSGLIAMRNALLDLDALVEKGRVDLLPHTPEWFSCAALPYDFDSDATCPEFLKFLKWMCEGEPDRIAVVLEWLGYCLTADTSYQKYLLLIGDGRNGKSVLLRVLGAMVGAHNCSAVGPEKFRDRFGLYPLIGKLVNICADVDVTKIDEEVLKALTGGDQISADRKYKDPISFTPTAKFVFATNNPPKIQDKTNGMWRRMLALPCDARITDTEEDKQLAEKLLQELPGIFNEAVKGLKRLKSQANFTECKAISEMVDDLRNAGDPARQFVMERCERDPNHAILAADLFKEANGWGAQHGIAIQKEDLGRALRVVFGIARQKRRVTVDPTRPSEYRGIRLKDAA